MLKFVRNICLFTAFLVPATFVTLNYSKHYCAKPNRHCIGEEYILTWDKWWTQMEHHHIYQTLITWISFGNRTNHPPLSPKGVQMKIEPTET